VTKYLSNISNN